MAVKKLIFNLEESVSIRVFINVNDRFTIHIEGEREMDDMIIEIEDEDIDTFIEECNNTKDDLQIYRHNEQL